MIKLLIFYFILVLLFTVPLSATNKSNLLKQNISVELRQDENVKMIVMPNDSTINDLIILENIDNKLIAHLNRNQVLHDQDIIILKNNINKCVSINDATVDELMSLKGIGEKSAQAIIDYRNSFGRFQKIEDIMFVPGIKNAKFEAIKPDICL